MFNQNVTPLAMLAILGLLMLSLIVVPLAEWPALVLYLAVITSIAVFLYRGGILPVAPAYPAALFLLALAVKLLGTTGRYWMVVDLYGGKSDALGYHEEAQRLAPFIRALDFSFLDWYGWRGEGSTQLVYITSAVYSVLPASLPGAFFIFSLFAFAGAVFCYRGARIAFPERTADVYLGLIFFAPSLLFWPSSLGKDAWILWGSGLVVWGWAVFVRRGRIAGLAPVVLGLLAIGWIRPHIAAIFVLAMGAAYGVFGLRNSRRVGLWLVGVAAVAILAGQFVEAGLANVGLESTSLSGLEEAYQYRQELTESGGSSYAPANMLNPAGALYGIVTVLFRPFPWEARNVQMLMTSVEAVVWLGLFWQRRNRLMANLQAARSDPFLAFAAIYALLMIFALTTLGNFGILARQRVMLLPVLWLLLV